MAIQACQGGFCSDGLVCTASNYCCQCPVGRSGGRCNQGMNYGQSSQVTITDFHVFALPAFDAPSTASAALHVQAMPPLLEPARTNRTNFVAEEASVPLGISAAYLPVPTNTQRFE